MECSIEGCIRPALARSYCSRHYGRWWRNGDPSALFMAAHGEPMAWMMSTIKAETEDCILWPFRSKYTTGYPSISYEGKLTGAHRLMCRMVHGEPPTPTHEAAHRCGTRLCVNHRHLRWATPSENAGDKAAHGTNLTGERNLNAKLTIQEVLAIRDARGTHDNIAADYHISRRNVGAIKSRKTWAWL